jgi:hypothetical protein
MFSFIANLFDWQSLLGMGASLVGTGISFFTGGRHKWALIGVIAVGVVIAFLWINLDRANLRTTITEEIALRQAAEQARGQAVIVANENAATNRKLVAAYESDLKALSVTLARERNRRGQTDILIQEIVKNAELYGAPAAPAESSCRTVLAAITHALDGVRKLRAADHFNQDGSFATKPARAAP